ncbi:MAG: Blue-light-activated protein [Gemmataceae bacterium]|nr:Blue-light-activated protein [Gemmataceae bacterium]
MNPSPATAPPDDPPAVSTTLLHQAADPFRLMVDVVKDYAIYMLDPVGRIVSWNTGAERIKGYKAEEVMGQPFARLFSAEEVAGDKPERVLQVARDEGRFEEEGLLVRKDGSSFWAVYTLSAMCDDGEHIGFSVVIRDITERKQAEEELRRSEKRFRSLISATAQLVWTADPRGESMTIPRGIPISGLSDESLLRSGWLQAVHPEDRAGVAASWRTAIATGQPYVNEFRLRGADGHWRHMRARAVPVLDPGGRIEEWIGAGEDVTDLKDAHEWLRAVLNSALDAIITADQTGVIQSVNTAAEKVFGYPAAELVGRNITSLMPDSDLARDGDDLCNYLRTGQTETIGAVWETSGRRKDGSAVPIELAITAFGVGDARYFTGVVRDVSGRKKLEAQLQQAQKMESIGRLAGGVAHDFNNLLTIICGYSDMLLTELPPADPTRTPVAAIRDAGERASGLTRQLLAFSRNQVLEPVVLDLNDVVEQSESMLRRLIGEDVTLVSVLAPALGRVKADPGQIDQIIMNLVINARDAMPRGGRVTLETKDVVIPQAQLVYYPDLKPGRYAQLLVTDTGQGMTDEVKARIFEPFFTTKEAGKGTGLGLATVYGIVKQSGGHISVYSEVGVGTTFKILLPVVHEAIPPPPSGESKLCPKGTETVLVAEDEEAVRRIARISLETLGYTVLMAENGADAIRLAGEHTGPIGLLVTDVVMPEMGGRQLATTLRSRHPGLKVLFMSGYTDAAVIRHGIIGVTDAFLQKPFTPLTLAKKIRDVLDKTT